MLIVVTGRKGNRGVRTVPTTSAFDVSASSLPRPPRDTAVAVTPVPVWLLGMPSAAQLSATRCDVVPCASPVPQLMQGSMRPWVGKLVSSARNRSEEHTSELQSLMRISYAVFCLKKKKKKNTHR